MRKKGYIFTDKTYSKKSIMSAILGLISLVSLCLVIYFSYREAGAFSISRGGVCLLSMLYALVGLGLAIAARMEKDRFYLFAYLGMVMNVISLLLVSTVLYAGAML